MAQKHLGGNRLWQEALWDGWRTNPPLPSLLQGICVGQGQMVCPSPGPQSCEQPLSSARWPLALEHSCSGTAFCKVWALFLSFSCSFKVVIRVSTVCLCISYLVGCHQEKLGLIWGPKKENWPNFHVSINWYGALQSTLTVGFDLQKKYVWGEPPYLLFLASSGCTGGIPSQLKIGW